MEEHRRCSWAVDPLLMDYHDNEFGKILSSDNALFEKLTLEVFQAGLSWRTVLVKRDALREAFRGFDISVVASMQDDELDALLEDARIIRNQKKIYAARQNARAALEIIALHGSLFKYIYSFSKPTQLCASLRQAGFAFIGETIAESFMQSIGILPAHMPSCFLYRPSSIEV
jgi:DNA-3-methyladenine glycosylase I